MLFTTNKPLSAGAEPGRRLGEARRGVAGQPARRAGAGERRYAERSRTYA
jgi:hypothetical protein